jgi:hypothetical protein
MCCLLPLGYFFFAAFLAAFFAGAFFAAFLVAIFSILPFSMCTSNPAALVLQLSNV